MVALKNGATRHEAMLDACSKRATPILMTTVAMGARMLPIALKIGADADFRAPMAIAGIGGLITSTVLRCSTCRWCSAALTMPSGV
jgi:multidrug efflux pump subunit AcrB